MSDRRHESLIDLLVEDGASRRGFRDEVRRYCPEVDEEIRTWPKPDAWKTITIVHEGIPGQIDLLDECVEEPDDLVQPVIVCYEVEVTHPLKEARMDDYVDLWAILDFYADQADLALVLYDRFGVPRQVPMSDVYLDGIARAT